MTDNKTFTINDQRYGPREVRAIQKELDTLKNFAVEYGYDEWATNIQHAYDVMGLLAHEVWGQDWRDRLDEEAKVARRKAAKTEEPPTTPG